MTKNIRIGKDKWIQWVDFSSSSEKDFNIDNLLAPTWDFWKLLETECVAECCGIEAFSFWEETIIKASTHFDRRELIQKINHLKTEVQNSFREVISSSRLNNRFDKSVFIQILEHIVNILQENLPSGVNRKYSF